MIERADVHTSGIIATSRKKIRKSKAYHQHVWHIKADIALKYEPLIHQEKNLLNKMLLKIKMRIEIVEAIHDLTSSGKLYSNQ